MLSSISSTVGCEQQLAPVAYLPIWNLGNGRHPQYLVLWRIWALLKQAAGAARKWLWPSHMRLIKGCFQPRHGEGFLLINDTALSTAASRVHFGQVLKAKLSLSGLTLAQSSKSFHLVICVLQAGINRSLHGHKPTVSKCPLLSCFLWCNNWCFFFFLQTSVAWLNYTLSIWIILLSVFWLLYPFHLKPTPIYHGRGARTAEIIGLEITAGSQALFALPYWIITRRQSKAWHALEKKKMVSGLPLIAID